MRRSAGITVVALALTAAGVAAPARADDLPYLPRPCSGQPGDELFQRPASCRRILYKYGPLPVTPGDNLILVGPVTIERPLIEGSIVRFKPNLERVDGSIPDIDILHLHHAVWFSTRFALEPLFASGEEKTIVRIPDGYGIPVRPQDTWLLNYMLHNQSPAPDNVFITYELDVIPSSDPAASSIRPVTPYWLDVGSYNVLNPIYNTQRGFGTAGECAFPREQCAAFDPYGKLITGQGKPGNGVGYTRSIPAGTVVWMQGHVHPGGLRTEVSVRRGGVTKRVFNSHTVYYDPGGPLSWDMSQQVTPAGFRLRVSPGDTFVTNSVYETARASWYEGMGITVMFSADGDPSGVDPFATPLDPNAGVLTHGHMPEAGNHGGAGEGAPITSVQRMQTTQVGIGLFAFVPGTSPRTLPVPSVARGQDLTFTNLDAAAMIFHTVTACANPCDGATGISYPLANGAVDFDSLELGFGVPSATAAANRASYTLRTGGMGSGVYTYFCRVHPSMRGAFEVR